MSSKSGEAPPDRRSWSTVGSLKRLAPGDVVAVRWPDHWKIAAGWRARSDTEILCELPGGGVVTVTSPSGIVVHRTEKATKP